MRGNTKGEREREREREKEKERDRNTSLQRVRERGGLIERETDS